ncbi:MAG: hypothetical protein ACRD2J_05645 [Thermoanaerobaculia bacterium]
MAERREWKDEEKTREENVTGGKTKSLYSEAHPGADRDRDTATSGTTSGGAAGEIQDLSDVPEPGKKGRGSGSGV